MSVKFSSRAVSWGCFFLWTASLTIPAKAAITDLRSLVQGDANLLYHYTFEGDSVQRLENKTGGGFNLREVAYGTGSTANLSYTSGYDGGTIALNAYRAPGSFNDGGGAGLTTGAASGATGDIPIPTNFTVEYLVKNTGIAPTGTVGYTVALRGGTNERGYGGIQGTTAGGLPILTALAGSASDNAHEVGITQYNLNDWYYVAVAYEQSGGNTTITTYSANISQNSPYLMSNTKTVSGGPGAAAPLSIGIGDFRISGATPRYQIGLLGSVDEVAFYNSKLNYSTVQSHLSALLGTQVPASVYYESFTQSVTATTGTSMHSAGAAPGLNSTGWSGIVEQNTASSVVVPTAVTGTAHQWKLADANGADFATRSYSFGQIVGAGTTSEMISFTEETNIDRSAQTVKAITFEMRNDNVATSARVAVRIGTQWYASEQTFSDPNGTVDGNSWESHVLTFNPAAGNWRLLNWNSNDIVLDGAALGSELPMDNITGVGMYFASGQSSGDMLVRFDSYQVFAAPVPEPSTWIIATIGLACCWTLRKRFSRQDG